MYYKFRKDVPKEPWIINGVFLLACAILPAFISWYLAKKDSELLKKQVNILNQQYESLDHNMSRLADDNSFLVRWTIKSPEQIDMEIQQLEDLLKMRLEEIHSKYKLKQTEAINKAAQDNVLSSPVNEYRRSPIVEAEKKEVQNIQKNVEYKIRELQTQKRKLLSLSK